MLLCYWWVHTGLKIKWKPKIAEFKYDFSSLQIKCKIFLYLDPDIWCLGSYASHTKKLKRNAKIAQNKDSILPFWYKNIGLNEKLHFLILKKNRNTQRGGDIYECKWETVEISINK